MVERAHCLLVGFLIAVVGHNCRKELAAWKELRCDSRHRAQRLSVELQGAPGQQRGRRTTLEIGGTAVTSSQLSGMRQVRPALRPRVKLIRERRAGREARLISLTQQANAIKDPQRLGSRHHASKWSNGGIFWMIK
jgi:hypothetical protein